MITIFDLRLVDSTKKTDNLSSVFAFFIVSDYKIFGLSHPKTDLLNLLHWNRIKNQNCVSGFHFLKNHFLLHLFTSKISSSSNSDWIVACDNKHFQFVFKFIASAHVHIKTSLFRVYREQRKTSQYFHFRSSQCFCLSARPEANFSVSKIHKNKVIKWYFQSVQTL